MDEVNTIVKQYKGWAYPLIVAHYRIYGDPDSWNSYGERHIIVDTDAVMPDYRDWPNFYYLDRKTPGLKAAPV